MKIDTDRIKQQTDLRQLAAKYTRLKGHHSQAGSCPKCKGSNRFVVYPDKFLCRHCHPIYGDAIEFARWLNNFDFRQAVYWLANGTPPTIATDGMPKTPLSKPRPLLVSPSQLWQERAAAFVSWAMDQLWDPVGRAGLDYLLKRGLTEETIIRAGLGFNPKDLHDSAQKWGVSDRNTIWLPGPGVVIPWLIDGGLHRVNIRLLTPRNRLKYIGPAGWNGVNPLYNADSITPHKPVLLVEGEFCALTINQEAGDLITSVATGSKDAAQAGRWIARLSAVPLVLLAFDAELDKGDEAARRWAELLPHNSCRWRPLLKDINEMHQAGHSIHDWVASALNVKY